jgi:hypothetical protein
MKSLAGLEAASRASVLFPLLFSPLSHGPHVEDIPQLQWSANLEVDFEVGGTIAIVLLIEV